MAANRDNPEIPRPVVQCRWCGDKCRLRPGAVSQVWRCPHCGRCNRSAAADELEAEAARPPARKGPKRATSVTEITEVDPLEDLEVRRKPLPAPRLPLWSGVYSFPLQASGLRAWFLFGLGLSLVALVGGGLHYVIDLYRTSDLGGIMLRVCILYVSAFVAFVLWTGTYAGGVFLAIIEDTGAGNPKVGWPDESIWEGLFRFLGLVWVFLCAAVPLGLAAAVLRPYLGGAPVLRSLVPSAVLIFPVVLLSGLGNGCWFMLWSSEVLVGLVVRPLVLLTLYIMSGLLLCLSVALGYLTIMDYGHFLFLAPLTGFVWSGCLLIYGRLLGRVAWVITGEHERAERQAQRRKRGSRRRRFGS